MPFVLNGRGQVCPKNTLTIYFQKTRLFLLPKKGNSGSFSFFFPSLHPSSHKK